MSRMPADGDTDGKPEDDSPARSPGGSSRRRSLDEHFLSPQNARVLEEATHQVRVDNPVCGDLLDFYIRMNDQGRIAASSFQVLGCPAAIAAGSVLTGLVKDRSMQELRAVDKTMIAGALGGLSSREVHAAVLAADAVAAVLRDMERESR